MPEKEMIDIALLIGKLNAQLSQEEEKIVTEWLQEKPEHQQYFDRLKAFHENGSYYEKNKVAKNRLWASIEQEIDRPVKRKKMFFGWGVAASVILLIGVFLWRYQPQPEIQLSEAITPGVEKAILITHDGKEFILEGGKTVDLLVEGVKVQTTNKGLKYIGTSEAMTNTIHHKLRIPRGGEFYVELADGSKIWLNAASELEYPIVFNEQERKIALSGEAFFEVAHNANKPFTVASNGQEVKVLGTSFNVSAYESDHTINTTLVEGKVKVVDESDTNTVILQPNQQSVYHKAQQKLEQREVNVKQYTAWRYQKFYFEDRSLAEIMAILSRWYDFKVQFKKPELANTSLTGGFQRYDDFNLVKEIIEAAGDVTITQQNNIVMIE